MNITRENIDALNAIVTIKLDKEDYNGKVDHTLLEYRKKARIDGFRPGKVPMGLINKMYRKPVMAEEVQKLLSETLFKYIDDEKISILGEPMPSETKTFENDWENAESFTFSFDLGISPEIKAVISEKDKYPGTKLSPTMTSGKNIPRATPAGMARSKMPNPSKMKSCSVATSANSLPITLTSKAGLKMTMPASPSK